jgi:hypothetical protein
MKKIASFLVLIILISNQLFATEQESDILHNGKEKLTIDIGWGHPSPLETYYRQNTIQYPFTMLSTANYRGHVATWKIDEGKFYLVEVAIEKEKFKPEKFKIESNDKALSTYDKVFADWFNGILVCQKRSKKNYWKTEYSVYIHVKNGMIQKTEKITDKDFKRIQNITEKDTSDLELMSKYSMLFLNQSYISYYFRLHDNEEITIHDKKGFVRGKNGNSIILEYFDNDHMKWIYNWENFEASGAPNGNWEIQENKLILSSINLHTGLEFDGAEKILIDLKDVFPDKEPVNGKILVDWATGIYIVTHGETEKDKFDFERFKETEYTLLRINKGIVEESRTIPSDFNFKEVPEDTDEELKKLINDYKEQKKKN